MKPRISAERDIVYIQELLTSTGFKKSDIRILKNQQANKSSIVSAFQQLTKECKSGDIVYIHFSGHGQLMTDINGDETPNAFGEQWDEAWIPYDASYNYDSFDHGELHLSDDEIGTLLTAIRGRIGRDGKILVVVDACHSGDSTRENEDTDSFYEIVGDSTTYTMEYPVYRGTSKEFIIPQVGKRKSKERKIKEDWITVSACESYQLNSEMFDSLGLRIGMLTYGIYGLSSRLSKMSNEAFQDYLIGFMKKNIHGRGTSAIYSNP